MPDETSNRKLSVLDGISAKIKGQRILSFPVFLIGQLAKNDSFKSEIEGKKIIELAVDIIRDTHKLVGGRMILIECNDNKYLKSFYINSGFEVINKDTDSLLQMIAFL